jgi:16S rRNA processing protein RimM
MTDSAVVEWPDDAIEVGAVIGPWGIQGWVKIKPYASDPQALLASRTWLVKASPGSGTVVAQSLPGRLTIVTAREHGDTIIAQAREVADRTLAEALKGARLFVPRRSFPAAGPDEFYWVDLMGLAVLNRQGEALGNVVGLIDTGPHCVLRVGAEGQAATEAERLIPFVEAYVDSVSLEARRIVVDWGLDY